jgi:hypothetical protein
MTKTWICLYTEAVDPIYTKNIFFNENTLLHKNRRTHRTHSDKDTYLEKRISTM